MNEVLNGLGYLDLRQLMHVKREVERLVALKTRQKASAQKEWNKKRRKLMRVV